MKYLLDTHILLWWLEDSKRLKSSVRKIIQDDKNELFISVISGAEISIKNRIGKLPLKTTVKKIFEASSFAVLEFNINHLIIMDKEPLQPDHKDPFDWILISQAKAEKLTLITSDPKIWQYRIALIKA